MKKGMIKKISKRIISFVLVFAMIITSIGVPSTTTQAGLIGNVITGRWSAIAIGAVERGTIYAIGAAADASTDETLSQALSITKRILAGGQSAVNSQIVSMCKQMSAELSALYNVVATRSNEIEEYLKKIDQDTKKEQLITAQNYLVRDFYVEYEGIVLACQELFDALADFRSDSVDSKKRLKAAYQNLYNYYDDDPSSGTSTIAEYNKDLREFLLNISPYDPNYTPSNKASRNGIDDWGSKLPGINKTYLNYMYEYLTAVTGFENNIYDGIVSAINMVSGIGCEYIQAYRYYAELETMLISSDSSLSESEIRSRTEYVWDNFNTESWRLQRGINQMCSLYENELNTYMRSYDTLINMEINNYHEEQNAADAYARYPAVQESLKNSSFSDKTLKDTIISQRQYFYQFRIYNDAGNKTYAIRNMNHGFINEGGDQELYKKTNSSLPVGYTVAYHMGNDNTGFSLSYINLTQGSKSPKNYKMLTTGKDLSAIVSAANTAYSANGTTLVDYIGKELSMLYGSQNVYLPKVEMRNESTNEDELKKGQFLLLDTPIEWDADNTLFGTTDACVTWFNISMPLTSDGLESHRIKIDSEDDIWDKKEDVYHGDAVIMYVANVPSAVINTQINSTNGGWGNTIVKCEGQDYNLAGLKDTLESGKVLTVKAKPNIESTIKSIVLKDKGGNVLETFLEDIKETVVEIRDENNKLIRTEAQGYSLTQTEKNNGYKAQEISNITTVQEILQNGGTNEDGYYEFKFPVPYQDATIEITYDKADTTLYTYPVTLKDVENPNVGGSYDAVLQFSGYDYLSEKNFKQGEEVIFSVTPYNQMLCTGVTLKDAKGKVIEDVPVKDVTDEVMKISPNERLYSFTMPAQAVTVEATLEQGYLVSVMDDSHSSHKFKNLNCFDIFSLFEKGSQSVSWENSRQITYAPNSMVSLEAIADIGYTISSIEVYDEDKNTIDVMLTGMSGIEFVMPEKNVNIRIQAAADCSGVYGATLKDDTGWSNFVNSSGKKLNINTGYYEPGDTVRFKVDEKKLSPDEIYVSDKTGNRLNIPVSGNDSIYSFTMPNQSVDINVRYGDISIRLSETELTLLAGQEHTLVAMLSDNYVDKSVVWTTSDDSIATVDENGVVTGVATGTATITATSTVNPFCYAVAKVSVKRAYIIKTYDELCDFSTGVNLGINDYMYGNFQLGNDIICPDGDDNIIPVGTREQPFKGSFDGCGYEISNIKITADEVYEGLFGYTVGASIENLTLSGNINCTANSNNVGALAAYIEDSTIRNIYSKIDITNSKDITTSPLRASGIVATAKSSTVDRCIFVGNIKVFNCFNGIAGIVSSAEENVTITNCANIGQITVTEVNELTLRYVPYVGGITAVVQNSGGSSFVLENCYNYGRIITVLQSDNTGGILGYTRYPGNPNIKNNYYLETSYGTGIGYNSSGYADGAAIVKQSDAFASGEVAYLLNSSVTNGTQAWYQNLDNDQTPDVYPLLVDNKINTVYKVDLEDKTYSNYPQDGTYPIYTFEELKEVPVIVQSHPKANFVLMNNIYGNGGTLTQPIGSDDNPYCGTFDGQGYYIFDFNIKNPQGDAALFGTLGSEGTVKKLGIFYQNVTGKRAAGIVAVNNGIIDECISGSNVSGTFNDRKTGERRNLSEINTFITGEEMAGGVVIENNGTIRNIANYAKTVASAEGGITGGIATVNSGTIENCFSRGNLSAEKGIAGGIAGKIIEGGSINIAYCSATTIEGITQGAVFGQNGSGTVTNTFYLDTLTGDSNQGLSMTMAEMRNDSFTTSLNSLIVGISGLHEWYRDSNRNAGYPVLSSSMMKVKELYDAYSGLTVKGTVHADAKLRVNQLDNTGEIYQALLKYAEAKGIQIKFAGEPLLHFADQDDAAYEDSLSFSLDLKKYSGEGYKVLIYRDGKVKEISLNDQMIAFFEATELVPFAVLTEKNDVNEEASIDESDIDMSKDISSVNAPKTGDNSNVLVYGFVLIASVLLQCIVIALRRKKVKACEK